MNAALSLDELDRLATDPGTPEMVRAQAATSAAGVRAAGQEARTAELAQLAADAVARITAAKRAGKKKGKPESRPWLALVMLPPRAFLALWADLDGWTTRYDAAEIAQALTPPEWERVERVLAETVAFLTIIRDRRTGTAGTEDAEPPRVEARAG
jgi:ParB family chromosome partitioning protein